MCEAFPVISGLLDNMLEKWACVLGLAVKVWLPFNMCH